MLKDDRVFKFILKLNLLQFFSNRSFLN